MNASTGPASLARTTLLVSAAFSVMIAAALAAPSQADAHQTAGGTLIYVDGNLVKKIQDDHFTYSKVLKPGCHNVKVVSREDGERAVQRKHACLGERAKLTVTVNDGSVSSSVATNY